MVQDIETLQKELATVKQELEAKTKECEQLKQVRDKLDQEVAQLSACVFEEANKMVQTAMTGEYKAKKRTKEAFGEIEALKTEINTLKALSLKYIENGIPLPGSNIDPLNSTHNNPPSKQKKYFSKLLQSPMQFRKVKHNNNYNTTTTTTTHNQHMIIQQQQSTVVPQQTASAPVSPYHTIASSHHSEEDQISTVEKVNHAFYEEFLEWYDTLHTTTSTVQCCQCPLSSNNITTSQQGVNGGDMNGNCQQQNQLTLNECKVIAASSLLTRILYEDILPCLDFTNTDISTRLSCSIHQNHLCMEPMLPDDVQATQKCSLTMRAGECKYKLKMEEIDGDNDEQWFPVSLAARERITKVCDFFTYLRYIQKGIIKHNADRIFDAIICHRREMALSRIGPSFSTGI